MLGVLLALGGLVLLSCTPTVKRVAIYKEEPDILIVKKGNFSLSKEARVFMEKESRKLGIKIPEREEIERFIRIYLKDKKSLEIAIKRANLYVPYIKPIIKRYGLPEELALLPFIESGFNPFAVSASGAGGLWQLMPSTAKLYGLRVNRFVDERFDLYRATEAASKYLRDLYKKFGSWELALAGYNCGEGCVLRKTGGGDFWSKRDRLPSQTQDFVPRFFAALLIARDPQRYGLEVSPISLKLERRKVRDRTSISQIARKTGISESTLRDLNPHIKSDNVPSNTTVYLPLRERKVVNTRTTYVKQEPELEIREFKKPVWTYRRDEIKVHSVKRSTERKVYRRASVEKLGRIVNRKGKDITLVLDNGAVVYIKD